MIIIFKSQQHEVQWYAVVQVISSHCINPSLIIFFLKFDREIIWKFCFIRLLYLALLITHLISFEVQRRLSKFYSTHNKSQSWHLTNDHSRMVEMSCIRNYAFHDPMPGHQLNILWQNAVSDLYIFDHRRVSTYFLGLDSGAFHTTIKGGSLWDLKLCQMRVVAISVDAFQNLQTWRSYASSANWE